MHLKVTTVEREVNPECFISARVRPRSDRSLLAKVTAVTSEKSKGSNSVRIQPAIKPFLTCTKETVSCSIHCVTILTVILPCCQVSRHLLFVK